MSHAVNRAYIKGLIREFKDVDSCVVIGPRRLTVAEVDGLRQRLREKEIRMRVVKNTLARLALEETPIAPAGELFDGPSAVLYGGDSAITISKAIVEEAKKAKDKIVIQGGYAEGELLDAAGIDALSKAPSREEALAMILASMFGPVSDLARAMDGLLTEVHGLIGALEEKRGEEGQE